MIILGVDPGTRATGYGLIARQGNRVRHLGSGVIPEKRQKQGPFPLMLHRIHSRLQELLEEYCPDIMAVEDIFYAVNVKTALRLGHTRGVVLLAAAQSEIPVAEYSPLEVKKAVVGYGRADKTQIQWMVQRLLRLQARPEPHDTADALAVALCHCFKESPTRHSPLPESHRR